MIKELELARLAKEWWGNISHLHKSTIRSKYKTTHMLDSEIIEVYKEAIKYELLTDTEIEAINKTMDRLSNINYNFVLATQDDKVLEAYNKLINPIQKPQNNEFNKL